MKTSKKIWLIVGSLFLLSSCYVQVDNGHRHWHHHHDDHEVIIEHR